MTAWPRECSRLEVDDRAATRVTQEDWCKRMRTDAKRGEEVGGNERSAALTQSSLGAVFIAATAID
jgi:hypothetical protein